ncbi:hypothetical protein GQF49_05725 [Microbacter sp. ANSKLAB05]|nr:hypothetical protein [Microbacter sp. ANSKLAB05]
MAIALLLLAVSATGLGAARAVLFPRVDQPEDVDAIVVVAGARDDRYAYARHMAEQGVASQILVSQPPSTGGEYAAAIEAYCAEKAFNTRDRQRVEIECFKPDVDTTEGETTAATRIARERGYDSLLVLTYWGHVSRVRIYFEQCFDGHVYVADPPEALAKSRRAALLHETGGYFKAFFAPAC